MGNKKAPVGTASRSTELLRKWRAGGLKDNELASKVMKISSSLIKPLKNTKIHVIFFLGVVFGEQKSPCGSVSPKHRILEKKNVKKAGFL